MCGNQVHWDMEEIKIQQGKKRRDMTCFYDVWKHSIAKKKPMVNNVHVLAFNKTYPSDFKRLVLNQYDCVNLEWDAQV